MIKCEHCSDTGELGGYGSLDCGHCDAAVERAALNATIANLPPMTAYDKHWAAFQMGKATRDEEVQALVDMLRKMWGQAIELGETDYFDDPQFGKADWSADCEAAHRMIAKYRKGLAKSQ